MAEPRFGRFLRPSSVGQVSIRSQVFAEGRLNGGMIVQLDSADIPTSALQLAKNAAVRFDKTSRRYGCTLLTPLKPDSLPVLALTFIKKKIGTPFTVRFTRSSIFRRGSVTWTPIVGVLSGTDRDRIQAVNVLDELIFSNNGADEIQLINFNTDTFADLGNAPKYRFVTGFFNRAVGAALRDVNEVQVGWSGDGNITEWNPAVDETAGNSPILESPSDLSDFITGIYAFTNNMILLREQSIWVVTKQPIPTNPFNFYAAFPGVGCDAPNSVGVIPNGLCWFDSRTRTIWAYTPGSAPERIGFNIERDLLKGIDDPGACFGSYSSINNEYTLCLPRAATSIVSEWTFNFNTKSWVYNERDLTSCVEDLDLGTGGITIDELIGTIDELIGTIDDLSPSNVNVNTRIFGRMDGEIMYEDKLAELDVDKVFTTIIDSKSFRMPTLSQNVQEFKLELFINVGGKIDIYFSKNGGATDDSYRLVRTIPKGSLQQGKPQLITVKRPQRCRNFAWRLVSSEGQFDVINYEIITSKSNTSDQRDNTV